MLSGVWRFCFASWQAVESGAGEVKTEDERVGRIVALVVRLV